MMVRNYRTVMEHYGGSNIRVNVRVEVADDFVSGWYVSLL